MSFAEHNKLIKDKFKEELEKYCAYIITRDVTEEEKDKLIGEIIQKMYGRVLENEYIERVSYKNGFKNGYSEGYSEGLEEGYKHGLAQGFDNGYNNCYEEWLLN